MVPKKPRKEPAVFKKPGAQAHELANSVIDTVREPLIALDQDLRVVKVNRSFYELFKVKPEETVGQHIYDLGNKQFDIPKLRELLESIIPQTSTYAGYEIEYDFPDVGWRTMLINARQIPGLLGKEQVTLVAIEDITERKLLEKALAEKADKALNISEVEYRGLVENISEILYTLDTGGNITYVSPVVERFTQYKVGDLVGKPFTSIIYPDDLPSVMESYNRLMNGQMEPLEYRVLDKDGRIIFVRSSSQLIYKNGQIEGVTGLITDITEHKRAEEALLESEARYRLLAEHTTDAVWIMDMNLKTMYHSPSAIKRRGFTPQEIMEMPVEQNLTPESLKLASELFLKELPRIVDDPDYNQVYTLELEYYRKDGTTMWSESYFSIIRDAGGKPVSILGESRDITERRIIETALRKSEEQYRFLSDHTTDTIFLLDMSLKLTYHSPSGEKLRGFTPQELIEMPLEQQLTPESLILASELFFEEIPKVEADPGYNPTRILDLEYPCKDGTTVWAETKFSIIRDGSGKAVSILGEGRGITDRKKAEEALRESERKFKSIVEHITDIFYVLNLNYEMIYISPQAEKVMGYKLEEVQHNWQSYLTDNPINLAAHEKTQLAMTTGEKQGPYLQEFRDRNETKRLIEINESPLKNDKGQVIGMAGAARDVTERESIAAKLRDSEEKYRLLVENAMEAIFIAQDGMLKFANNRTMELTGYSQGELTSKPFTEFIYPDDRDMVIDRHLRRVNGEEVQNRYTFRIICKPGDIKWVEVSVARIIWEGRPATLNLLTDITERKLAEEKILFEKNRAQSYLDTVETIIVSLNTEGRITSINRKGCQLFGCREDDLLGQLWFSTCLPQPDGMENVYPYFLRLISGDIGVEEYFENTIINWSGEVRQIAWHNALIRDEKGRITGSLSSGEDITEREQAVKALQVSEEKYRSLVEEAAAGIASIDLDGKLTFVNNSVCQWVGATQPDVIGRRFADFLHPEDLPGVTASFLNALGGDRTGRAFEFRITQKNGQIMWLRTNPTTIIMDGKTVGFNAIMYDVTDRKAAEENLVKSYESLKKTLNDAINTIVKIVEMRDPYTAGHQSKVADLAIAIAREMKLDDARVNQLRISASVHDIGKMYVPSDILSKPGKLTDIELNLIRTHAGGGYDIIKSMDFPSSVADTILQHHERLDGSGYPNQLKGEDILLEAKILAVADVVEAMSSHRPYRQALGLDKALDEITKNKGKLYDPDVVNTCMDLFNSDRFEFK